MDLEPMDTPTAAQVLGNLETINRWLGGVRPTLSHFNHFSKRWAPGEKIRVLDWGTGGADMPRALVDWSRRRGFQLTVTGIDQDPVTVAYARTACAAYPEIKIVQSDATTFAEPSNAYDYVLSSLTLHHLSDDHIIALLQKSDRLARRGLVMNDLHRSSRAWAWIWLLSRLGRAHSMVQHDGPLSVQRAFTRDDLRRYAKQARLPYLQVNDYFGHRLTLAGEKE